MSGILISGGVEKSPKHKRLNAVSSPSRLLARMASPSLVGRGQRWTSGKAIQESFEGRQRWYEICTTLL